MSIRRRESRQGCPPDGNFYPGIELEKFSDAMKYGDPRSVSRVIHLLVARAMRNQILDLKKEKGLLRLKSMLVDVPASVLEIKIPTRDAMQRVVFNQNLGYQTTEDLLIRYGAYKTFGFTSNDYNGFVTLRANEDQLEVSTQCGNAMKHSTHYGKLMNPTEYFFDEDRHGVFHDHSGIEYWDGTDLPQREAASVDDCKNLIWRYFHEENAARVEECTSEMISAHSLHTNGTGRSGHYFVGSNEGHLTFAIDRRGNPTKIFQQRPQCNIERMEINWLHYSNATAN